MPEKQDNTICRIAVIIVTFNNISHIENCLASLSAALYGFVSRIFIIDNASSDGTIGYLQNPGLAAKFTFNRLVLFFNNTNTGFTHAVNQGLQLADEDYIILLNPDVILQPQAVSVLAGSLNDSNTGIVAPQLRYPNGSIQPSCRRFPRKRDVLFTITGLSVLFSNSAFFNSWKMPDFDHNSTRFVDQPQGAFLMTRRDVLQKTGLLDERFPMFFSDVDWCYRVTLQNYRILFNPGASVIHYKGASVYRKRLQMIVSSHRSFVDYFKKYDRSRLERFTTCLLFITLLTATLPRLLGTAIFDHK